MATYRSAVTTTPPSPNKAPINGTPLTWKREKRADEVRIDGHRLRDTLPSRRYRRRVSSLNTCVTSRRYADANVGKQAFFTRTKDTRRAIEKASVIKVKTNNGRQSRRDNTPNESRRRYRRFQMQMVAGADERQQKYRLKCRGAAVSLVRRTASPAISV